MSKLSLEFHLPLRSHCWFNMCFPWSSQLPVLRVRAGFKSAGLATKTLSFRVPQLLLLIRMFQNVKRGSAQTWVAGRILVIILIIIWRLYRKLWHDLTFPAVATDAAATADSHCLSSRSRHSGSHLLSSGSQSVRGSNSLVLISGADCLDQGPAGRSWHSTVVGAAAERLLALSDQ